MNAVPGANLAASICTSTSAPLGKLLRISRIVSKHSACLKNGGESVSDDWVEVDPSEVEDTD